MVTRRTQFAAVAAAVVAVLPGGAGSSSSEVTAVSSSSTTIRVSARDFRFVLKPARVRAPGVVRFVVRNDGAVPHDFKLGRRATKVLRPGQSQTVRMRLEAGSFAFLCTVPGHAKAGMRGRLAVGKAVSQPARSRPSGRTRTAALRLVEIGSFDVPVHAAAAPGRPDDLYVVEKAGRIVRVVDGNVQERPFLDIRERVLDAGEAGLLSVAFAPDHAESGRLYTYLNEARSGNIRLVEWRRSADDPRVVDPRSERTVLTIEKPGSDHNGGMLQFGPDDGLLYVGVGDGDSGNAVPPGTFAQRRDSLLGSILRIDPLGGVPYRVPSENPFTGDGDARPEVYATGLRNPWRFWLDPMLGLLVGDVGLGDREEIDLVPAAEVARGGHDFGWPCFEGTLPGPGHPDGCPAARPPLFEYPHDVDACSITGGVVSRDPAVPSLDGAFLFADFCGGAIRALRLIGAAVTVSGTGLEVPGVASFGVDAQRRTLVVSTAGPVYRLEPAS